MTNANGKVFATPNPPAPPRPVIFNEEICSGCNTCIEVCQMDIFVPNPEEGKPPIILFPDECWYGGCCVDHCPRPGASRLNFPAVQRVRWRDKNTGGSQYMK